MPDRRNRRDPVIVPLPGGGKRTINELEGMQLSPRMNRLIELAAGVESKGARTPLTAEEFEVFSNLLERLLASEETRTAWLLGFLFGSSLDDETEDALGN